MLRGVFVVLALVLLGTFFFVATARRGGHPKWEQGLAPSTQGASTLPFVAPSEPNRGHAGRSSNEKPTSRPDFSAEPQEFREIRAHLAGAIFDEAGELMPYQRVVFVRPEEMDDIVMAAKYGAYSDKQGYYKTKNVPILGEYIALFYGKSKDSPRIVGQVDVREGQNQFDVLLTGGRTLRGEFTMIMPPGSLPVGASVHLQLELRPAGSDKIAALGKAVTSHLAKDSEEPSEQGLFSIGGLDPGAYTLRIIFGADNSSYVERDVDLYDDDVVLPTEKFTLEMFMGDAQQHGVKR